MSDRPAKKDFAHLHIALARWKLAHPGQDAPDDDQAAELELDQAVDRHPASGSA
jgi:hypothetical protein